MGLDGVELIIALEKRFQIDIPDTDAEKLETPRKLINYISDRLNASKGGNKCVTQHAFYHLRNILIDQMGLPKPAIRPTTSLDELIPVPNRQLVWPQIQKRLEITHPTLNRSDKLRRNLALAVAGVFVISMGLTLPHFAEPTSLGITALTTISVLIILITMTQKRAVHFMPKGYTLSHLATVLAARGPTETDSISYSHEQVAVITRGIIMHQLGVTSFSDDDRFYEDLGAG